MKRQVYNPYLPLMEYLPDGEPHIFNDRLYIFGSHDRSHGKKFCMNDYVCWSAPCEDLTDWRYEGFIYRKTDDPNNLEKEVLYAPDVAKGPDGKYYLYYGFGSKKSPEDWYIGVAVCDTPAGRYKYYGTIDLKKWSKDYFPFDPGVFVDEDQRVWLYYGFGSGDWRNGNKGLGGAVVELDKDMKTIISEPKSTITNKYSNIDEAFIGHAFFEASSMRKINGKYYLIYSSELSHELCYAISEKPDGKFTYGGVLISNADYGLKGCHEYKNWYGNNHGSVIEINGAWYIFYHRHTQRTMFSRQGCAEKIVFNSDGSFEQAECTSCGLNNGPLVAKGSYPSVIAANLYDDSITGICTSCKENKGTYYDEETFEGKPVQFIRHFSSTSHAVYKYFYFYPSSKITISIRGKANGVLTLNIGKEEIPISINISSKQWETISGTIGYEGESKLELKYKGIGHFDIKDIIFS